MTKHTIYDFHTHIDDYDVLMKYYEENIIPVVNCQSAEDYENLMNNYYRLKMERYLISDDIYYSMGIHPFDAEEIEGRFGEAYEDLIRDTNFIGEIGLDDKWCDISLESQKKAFIYSLELAKKYEKPVILHTKAMEKQVLEIIKDYNLKVVIHWYSHDRYIREFIDLGCYFTIGPAVLVDENVRKLAKLVPLNRILLETDGVDALSWLFRKEISPNQIRGVLETVCYEIASIKSETYECIVKKTVENSERLLMLR